MLSVLTVLANVHRVSLLAASSLSAEGADVFDVFQSGSEGYNCYRIPVLSRLPNGDVRAHPPPCPSRPAFFLLWKLWGVRSLWLHYTNIDDDLLHHIPFIRSRCLQKAGTTTVTTKAGTPTLSSKYPRIMGVVSDRYRSR